MYLYSYQNELDREKQEFLRLLYHDRRGGQMIRLRKQEGNINQYSTCDMEELAAVGTDGANYYTSVNLFRGKKREAEQIYCYSGIYLDLDCHAKDPQVVNAAKKRTAEILENAYVSGRLAVPTMITDSGRGFGIFYILEHSIAYTDRTEKQRNFFKTIRNKLFEKYEILMSEDKLAARADPVVIDDVRVCRMPGTYNSAAGAYCRLICATAKFYGLAELVQGCRLWDWKDNLEYQEAKKKKEKQGKKAKIISFAEYRYPFLRNRLTQIEKLIRMRGKKCTDSCREQMLFIAYSALVQLYGDEAAWWLAKLNKNFTDPLPQAELDHIIAETNANEKGYYKLPDDYIIRTLNISAEETGVLGFGKRAVAKNEVRIKREEKRKEVIELLQTEMTYQAIADTAGISRRTVCNIAKEEGLSRYRSSADRTCTEKGKSANFCTESVCVSLGGVSGSLLSTSCEVPAVLPEHLNAFLLQEPVTVVSQQLYRLYHECMSEPLLKDRAYAFLSAAVIKVDAGLSDRLSEQAMVLRELSLSYVNRIYNYDGLGQSVYSKGRMDVSNNSDGRIERYLANYRDQRFDIIESSQEYRRRLDTDVLHMVKIAFMQAGRLKRDTLFIEGRKVPVQDIKDCFTSLSYKDIVVLCERMEDQGTIRWADKPFFYVVQCVWKLKHPEDAEAQAVRLQKKKEKQKNQFHNFRQREDVDYNLITINAMRDIAGLPPLSAEDYRKMFF